MKRISKISVLSELLEEIEETHEALEESRNYWPSKDVYAEQVFYEKMVDKIEDAVDTIQLFRTELETTDLIPDADYKELSRILMDLELKLEDMK